MHAVHGSDHEGHVPLLLVAACSDQPDVLVVRHQLSGLHEGAGLACDGLLLILQECDTLHRLFTCTGNADWPMRHSLCAA